MSRKVGILAGDGIGPEITKSVVDVFKALKAPIEWVDIPCGEKFIESHGSPLPDSSVEMVRELGVAIKGPTATPIGKGHRSANVHLRKSLDLYANVRPCKSLPGVQTPFKNVDLIIVRENTEDVYTAIERIVKPGTAECLKIITEEGSRRIHEYAFQMAERSQRKKVTCVHKANIMKMTDGLFLEIFRDVAKKYPKIEATDLIVDNCCMQLVTKPQQFDVLVTENLYGDILSDLCAGLVGGLGIAGGANIGLQAAVFEAVHGTAPDIAGKGLANPTAMLMSSIQMLEHLKHKDLADKLMNAMLKTFQAGKSLTGDLGGKSGTAEFSQAVISNI